MAKPRPSSLMLDEGDAPETAPEPRPEPAATDARPITFGDCPDPGIYPDVPAKLYHGWDAASNSRLGDMLRSPAHCRSNIDNPSEPTPATRLGEAGHLAILQPELFEGRYTVAETCCAIMGKGKQCTNAGRTRVGGEWYCGVHDKAIRDLADEIEVLTADEFDACWRMNEAVEAHPKAWALLQAADMIEASATWHDKATGCRCKLRADALVSGPSVVLDLKTTFDASPEAFTKSIFNFGYHRQGAFYLHGLAALGRPFDHFVIIAVEKTPPFAVAVYRLEDEAIAAGWDQLMPLLERYTECQAAGHWPGYGQEIMDISLPAWAWKRIG